MEVAKSNPTDGTRMIAALASRELGEPVNRKRVQRVMRGRAGDRDLIVSGSYDHTVRVWDPATGRPLGDPLTNHTDPVNAVALGRASDRDLIVSGSYDRTMRVWDPATGRSDVLELLGPVSACAVRTSGLVPTVEPPSACLTARRLHRTLARPFTADDRDY